MSKATKDAIASVLNPVLLADKFKFDRDEFARHVSYKQIELDNGAVLSAPVDQFEQCFEETKKQGRVTYTTTGHIVDERLKKLK